MSETTPEGLARLREGASLVLDAHQREDCREDCPCRGTCRLCGWATWPCPSAEVAIALPALIDALEAERAKVAGGLALHKPTRVYDECDHDPEHECEPIEVYDYMGCSESVIGWACETCCYDDDSPIEGCPHGADHRDVPREHACPTAAALGATEGDGA